MNDFFFAKYKQLKQKGFQLALVPLDMLSMGTLALDINKNRVWICLIFITGNPSENTDTLILCTRPSYMYRQQNTSKYRTKTILLR